MYFSKLRIIINEKMKDNKADEISKKGLKTFKELKLLEILFN